MSIFSNIFWICFWTFLFFLNLSGMIRNCPELYETMQNYSKSFFIINCLKLFEIVWNYEKMSEIIKNYLKLSEFGLFHQISVSEILRNYPKFSQIYVAKMSALFENPDKSRKSHFPNFSEFFRNFPKFSFFTKFSEIFRNFQNSHNFSKIYMFLSLVSEKFWFF